MTEVLIPPESLNEFLRGYLVAALWSTNDNSEPNGGDPLDANYDIDSIDQASVAGARDECKSFMQSNWPDLLEYAARRTYDPSNGTVRDYAGHDFWLTRCGHGAGFWDRGLDELGDRLADAARACKEQDIYVGDDGKLYIMGFENYVSPEQSERQAK
jgi:hypothetical protein